MKPVKIAQIGIGHNHADATMFTLRKFCTSVSTAPENAPNAAVKPVN